MVEGRDFARKVAAYVEATCPRPRGILRWQDYLTGDDEADRPVLRAIAAALGIDVWQLFERAAAYVPVAPRVRVARPAEDLSARQRARKAKRVAARHRRRDQDTTCTGGGM